MVRKEAAAKTAIVLPTARWVAAFRKALVAWFARERRDLPWRRSRDPYSVWLSEIMLQQTTVAAVVAYYERFLARLSTVAALAAAPERDVLRLWEGLGYYRRARQLHRAAQVIVAEHGGVFPSEPDAVRALPGIGRYTAGAILSIAFDRPEPILEANTVRLLSRLAAYRDDPLAKPGQALLWAWAAALVPREEPGLFNQALMELGALVCTPREPKCAVCPVAKLCPTNKLGLQAEIPKPKAKKQFEDVREAAVLVEHRGKVLLVERSAGTRWAGLWDFPRFALEAESPPAIHAELRRKLQESLGIAAEIRFLTTTLKHGVTRFRITLDAYEAAYLGGKLTPRGFAAARWVGFDAMTRYPLNTTGRKISHLWGIRKKALKTAEKR